MVPKSLNHRFSLPLLRPEKNFEATKRANDNVWQNSLYKDNIETETRKQEFQCSNSKYGAQKPINYDCKSDLLKTNKDFMYKDNIRKTLQQDRDVFPDPVSDVELESRLAHLCLSVTNSALE